MKAQAAEANRESPTVMKAERVQDGATIVKAT